MHPGRVVACLLVCVADACSGLAAVVPVCFSGPCALTFAWSHRWSGQQLLQLVARVSAKSDIDA